MTEITFRIPSKAVTYGYVEIPVTLTDDPAPEALASMYVNYVYAFQKEEQAALQRLAEGPAQAGPTNPTTDTHEAAVEAIKGGLGATEVDEDAAPWDTPAVDAKPKPWEASDQAKPVAVASETSSRVAKVAASVVLDAAW